MRIGVPAEVKDNEFRVGMTPSGAHDLTADGTSFGAEAPGIATPRRSRPGLYGHPIYRAVAESQRRQYTNLSELMQRGEPAHMSRRSA